MIKKLLYIGMIFCSSGVMAQAVAPGIIDRNTPDVTIPKAFETAPAGSSALDAAPRLQETQNQQVLGQFSDIRFNGNSVMHAQPINAALAPFLNRQLTVQDIAKLNYSIEKLYYAAGYLLVKAVVPVDQDFTSGTLNIDIYEARVGDIQVQDPKNILSLSRGLTVYSPRERIFNKRSAERVLNNVNDLHGIVGSAALKPGTAYKTTDIIIAVDEVDENRNILAIDNYGSEYTGEYVAALHVEKDNFFKRGERLHADFRASDEALYSYSVGMEMPVGWDNLTLDFDYSRTDSDISNEFEAIGLEGISNTARLVAKMKPINNDLSELGIYGGFEVRQHESEANSGTVSKDDMRKIVFGTNGSWRGQHYFAYGDLGFSKGVNWFGASRRGDLGNSRSTGDQEAFLIKPIALLYLYPVQNGTLKLLGHGQLSNKTVLASDAFSIGGYGSVRGFDVAQEVGDDGAAFSAEYLHSFEPMPAYQAKLGAFADYGFVDSKDGSPVDDELLGVGVAAELRGEFIADKPTTLRLDYAWPVGDYNDPDVEDNGTFYFRVGQSF